MITVTVQWSKICDFYHNIFFHLLESAISFHCVVHSEKDRPLKFSLTSVRSDRELRNKFASLPGDEKKKGNQAATGFSPRSIRFFPKNQTPRESARRRGTFKYRRRAE